MRGVETKPRQILRLMLVERKEPMLRNRCRWVLLHACSLLCIFDDGKQALLLQGRSGTLYGLTSEFHFLISPIGALSTASSVASTSCASLQYRLSTNYDVEFSVRAAFHLRPITCGGIAHCAVHCK